MRCRIMFLAIALLILITSIPSAFAYDYLIWDPCQQYSATAFNDILIDEGYTGVLTDDIYLYIDDLADYKPLVFFPECFEDPNIEDILVDIQDEINNYLDNDGALFWEGPNIALFNDFYREDIFEFDMATCITEPFNALYGNSESFETLTFSTQTTYAPMIVGGDGCAFASIVNCPYKAVFRDGQFRTMLTSFPFYCINDQGPNTRADFVNAIMGWLTRMTDVADRENSLPDKFVSIEAYPNPFNIQTQIKINLPEPGDIKILIYNILGQPVEILYEDYMDMGEHSLTWIADGYSTGIYFARLENSRFTECTKLILLK